MSLAFVVAKDDPERGMVFLSEPFHQRPYSVNLGMAKLFPSEKTAESIAFRCGEDHRVVVVAALEMQEAVAAE